MDKPLTVVGDALAQPILAFVTGLGPNALACFNGESENPVFYARGLSIQHPILTPDVGWSYRTYSYLFRISKGEVLRQIAVISDNGVQVDCLQHKIEDTPSYEKFLGEADRLYSTRAVFPAWFEYFKHVSKYSDDPLNALNISRTYLYGYTVSIILKENALGFMDGQTISFGMGDGVVTEEDAVAALLLRKEGGVYTPLRGEGRYSYLSFKRIVAAGAFRGANQTGTSSQPYGEINTLWEDTEKTCYLSRDISKPVKLSEADYRRLVKAGAVRWLTDNADLIVE